MHISMRPAMNKAELHAFLTSDFDLVIDPAGRGTGRTYFLGTVAWPPLGDHAICSCLI